MTASAAKIIVALAIALAASLAVNAVQGYKYLGQRDTITALRRDVQTADAGTSRARAAAEACSASVQALADTATALEAQLQQARQQALATATQHYARADQILTTPPTAPGDACASAQARVRQILTNRKGGLGQ